MSIRIVKRKIKNYKIVARYNSRKNEFKMNAWAATLGKCVAMGILTLESIYKELDPEKQAVMLDKIEDWICMIRNGER